MKKAEKLYLETFREIRSYIINNGLKPGDMLPTEQAMCERWGSAATCCARPSRAWS
ncbi:MAG: hypothetical protein ACLR4A_12800 [Christensenellales bacterium]